MGSITDLRWKRVLEGLEQKRETPKLKLLEDDARYVPVSTRRMVWVRDDGQCSHTDSGGLRCEQREMLDLETIVPFVSGGRARAANLRLRCRVHMNTAVEASPK